MNVDYNEFFRQATIRICGSLEIETALSNCFEYLKAFLPIMGILLVLYEQDQGIAYVVASLASEGLQPLKPVFSFPEPFKNQLTERWLSINQIEVINEPAADPLHNRPCPPAFVITRTLCDCDGQCPSASGGLAPEGDAGGG